MNVVGQSKRIGGAAPLNQSQSLKLQFLPKDGPQARTNEINRKMHELEHMNVYNYNYIQLYGEDLANYNETITY